MSLRLVRRALLGGGAAVVAVVIAAAPSIAVVSATPVPQWIPNAAVHALASDGTYVYAAGIFTSLKSPTSNATQTHTRLVRINVASGVPDPTWTPSVDGDVLTTLLDPTDSVLYIGGAFTHVNGVARSRLAGISTSGSGALTSWNPDANFTVNALALNGSQVVIAGKFTHIAKTPQKYLAQVTSGGTIVSSFRPTLNAGAFSLSRPPGASFIVVGGAFDTIGGGSAPYVGAVNLTSGANTGWTADNACVSAPGHPCVGLSVVATATDYYVAISGPGGRVVDYAASTGARRWTDLADGNCEVVYLFNGTLYVGGHFLSKFAHSDIPKGLVAVNPANGVQFTDFQPSASHITSGNVAMVGTSKGLYVGGPTTRIAGTNQQNLALFPGA